MFQRPEVKIAQHNIMNHNRVGHKTMQRKSRSKSMEQMRLEGTRGGKSMQCKRQGGKRKEHMKIRGWSIQ